MQALGQSDVILQPVYLQYDAPVMRHTHGNPTMWSGITAVECSRKDDAMEKESNSLLPIHFYISPTGWGSEFDDDWAKEVKKVRLRKR